MISYDIYRKLMTRDGVSSATVSKATGIGQATLSDWKAGRSEPKADKLRVIADYFQVPFEYLAFGRTELKQPPLSQTATEIGLYADENKMFQKMCKAAMDLTEEEHGLLFLLAAQMRKLRNDGQEKS